MSIKGISERPLSWYAENCYLPAYLKALIAYPGRKAASAASVRRIVADFIEFAGCDPTVAEITATALGDFDRYSRAQGFSASAAAARRRRVEAIWRHAIPENSEPTGEPADDSLRRYVKEVFPALRSDNKRSTLKEYVRSVNRFCGWYGADIVLSDVTPELIAEFEADSRDNYRMAYRLRTLMRTHNPVGFRKRVDREKQRKPLNTGNGSEFLLANVYAKKYEPTALRSRAENTKRLYRTTLLMLDRFLGRSATLDDLNDDTINKYAAWRLAGGAGRRELSKFSVNKDLFNLLAIWRWCHRKGIVDVWPDVKLENAPKRTPIAWTEAEMRTIYRTTLGLPGRVGLVPACDWWSALVLVAFDTAERIGAVLRLDWSNVDLQRKWVRFPAEDRKGSRDDSAVRLRKVTIAALRKLRANAGDDGHVFPWPNCYTYVWRKYGQILAAAGLPNDRKRKFHCIRKTVASHAAAAGADATAMLRHSKREITEAYFDPRIVTRQQPADVLFDLDAKGGAT